MAKANALLDLVNNIRAAPAMVLLVDDQAMVAEALRRLLSEGPEIDFHYCSDPIEAVGAANEIKPTVILQDWVMPSISGNDLIQLFRSNPGTVETPIIVLSSEESPETKSTAFAAGANDYLVKIPDKTELIARIQYHSKAYQHRVQRDEAFRTLRESQQKLSDSNLALISVNKRLEETHEKLNDSLRAAEQRTKEATRLTELMDALQSCQTVEEGYEISGNTLPHILATQAGALCITRASRDLVEVVASWGERCATEKAFGPDECWALRRGRTHVFDDPHSPLGCAHVDKALNTRYVCVPLAAQGETLGVLYLECVPGDKDDFFELGELGRQANAAGERISLALANLRLRDVLRTQSIRDPLRRYMEETLSREIQRAFRNNEVLSLLMLDIDHFKQFNDTFGHQAGDTLLREFGAFLNRRTRGQDVACRFGGEEFAIILTGASIEAASQRAELLCQETRQLSVIHSGQTLGKVTISVGLSSFPANGKNSEELLKTADEALYLAKGQGRDRIAIAT
jgi:diguanylate cyclase (GGDEF)-like protein